MQKLTLSGDERMVVKVYRFKAENFPKANEVLKDDAYARNSYILRDGKAIGEDAKYYYLYVKSSEEFFTKNEKKLNDIPALEKVKKAESIIKKIEEEEDNVAFGVGAIFG
jgi:hypothetical protein